MARIEKTLPISETNFRQDQQDRQDHLHRLEDAANYAFASQSKTGRLTGHFFEDQSRSLCIAAGDGCLPGDIRPQAIISSILLILSKKQALLPQASIGGLHPASNYTGD
jgi:hypothetical protein